MNNQHRYTILTNHNIKYMAISLDMSLTRKSKSGSHDVSLHS